MGISNNQPRISQKGNAPFMVEALLNAETAAIKFERPVFYGDVSLKGVAQSRDLQVPTLADDDWAVTEAIFGETLRSAYHQWAGLPPQVFALEFDF